MSTAEAGGHGGHMSPMGGVHMGGNIGRPHVYSGAGIGAVHTNPGGKYAYRGNSGKFHTNQGGKPANLITTTIITSITADSSGGTASRCKATDTELTADADGSTAERWRPAATIGGTGIISAPAPTDLASWLS